MSKEAMKLALEALAAQHNDRTAYTRAKRAANATCGEFKNNPLSELIESGYMHGMGKQTELAINALREALAEQPAQQEWIETACALIKAADDAAADSDYMLDSNDCIKVLRGQWKGFADE